MSALNDAALGLYFTSGSKIFTGYLHAWLHINAWNMFQPQCSSIAVLQAERRTRSRGELCECGTGSVDACLAVFSLSACLPVDDIRVIFRCIEGLPLTATCRAL
jgi:hypothetical protein